MLGLRCARASLRPSKSSGITARFPRSLSLSAAPPSSSPADAASSPIGAAEPEIVLYERGPGRNALPRSGLGFSAFHTAYWLWYTSDFIPTVNASEMHQLHIDPMVGVVGIVFSSIIQAIFFTYPKRLVSRLTWKPDSKQLLYYTHTIPFVTPVATSPWVYSVGDAPVLDATSADAKHLVDKLLGDLSQYRGHLAVAKKGQWPPFLLDLSDPNDVSEPDLMFEALMAQDNMGGVSARSSSSLPRKKKGSKPQRESRLRKIVRRR